MPSYKPKRRTIVPFLCAAAVALGLLASCARSSPAADEAPPLAPEPFDGQPLSRFFTAHFVGAGECAVCHSGLRDSSGQDVSNDAHWRSTMMANAAKDPFFLAAMSAEVARVPDLAAMIESKCATCHTPMAYTEAQVDGAPSALLGAGFLDAEHQLHEAAMDGVSCTLCHQIQDAGLGQIESFSGGYLIDTEVQSPDRPIFGPFPDQFAEPMRMLVGYTPLEGPRIGDAELCATCHTLYTPYLDATGTVAGEFPEQTAYLEWSHSAYGGGSAEDTTCQQCHMPAARGAVVISNRPPRPVLVPRSPFSQHHFVGGNATLVELFAAFGPELDLSAGTVELEATLERTLERLQSMSARLSVVRAEVEGDRLVALLEIQNMAGHKLPTGFPARRAWLHLTVTDGQGQVVFESGQPQADGRITGNDADQDPAVYEPHYERIVSRDEVQIYESVMQDTEGGVTYALLRGATYAKDNRLLPDGFDKATAGEDIAVRGTAAGDNSFVDGSDRVSYEIDLQGRPGPYVLSAELLYQSVSYPFVRSLQGVGTAPADRFLAYYAALDRAPVVIDSAAHTMR